MAFSIGGSDVRVDSGDAIAVDGVGNLYVQGNFNGTIDADPGPGTYPLTSAGSGDLFVAKYDPAGGLLWAARMGGPQLDTFYGGGDLAVDGSGNVFVTGMLRGSADFGSFTLTSQGLSDVFVAKLDATGTFQWATRLGSSNDPTDMPQEEGFAIAADGLGNVYTTGRMVHPAGGIGNIFVAKHDGNGNLVWLKNVGQAEDGESQGNDLALDGAGNVYVTGQFFQNIDFDPGPGTFNLSSTKVRGLQDNLDAFALSLDSGGNFRWAFNVIGNKHDSGKGIAVDGSGNIYVAGDFESTSNDFDPGKSKTSLTYAGVSDVFVAKYSSSRSLIWARSMGGPAGEVCNAIAVDGSGNVYMTGGFEGTADFNPGSGLFNLTSAGSMDIFVSQLNSAGNYVWAGRMGGTSLGQ
jgi:Beta-propeller repeat